MNRDAESVAALIERLEAATGADRELDAAIFHAIGAPLPEAAFGYDLTLQRDPDKAGSYVMPVGEIMVRYEAPKYTANTDDALSLVPTDCWQEIKGPRKYLNIPTPVPNVWSAYIAKWNHEGDVMGWGATPALAICIAALRALQDRKP